MRLTKLSLVGMELTPTLLPESGSRSSLAEMVLYVAQRKPW